MRVLFFQQARHTLSRSDREAKREALPTHPSPQEGGKYSWLDILSPGPHSQQEGDPDAHFYPKEGASSDENPSQPGGASQPDAHLSQQEEASNDDIPYQQEVSSPNPIIILSDQEGESDTVENCDKYTNKSQLTPPPTGYLRPTHTPPTWYSRPTHRQDLEQLSQYIVNTQSIVII